MDQPLRWFAVAVQARQEKRAAELLDEQGWEVFLPTRIERHAWSDRIKDVTVALFPGYLFVRTRMSPLRRNELLAVRHVLELVGRWPGDRRVARHVPEADIHSLRRVVQLPVHLDPVHRLVRGTRVRVVAGALAEARGIVQQGADGRRRLVVQIELLGRGVAVDLAADDVVEQTDS